jgi:hypothetical protein
MPLTPSEVEAKLAALEERIAFLNQGSESLEGRFDQAFEHWDRWAEEVGDFLNRITWRLERLRELLPPPAGRRGSGGGEPAA